MAFGIRRRVFTERGHQNPTRRITALGKNLIRSMTQRHTPGV
jgi:hypothetical protein